MQTGTPRIRDIAPRNLMREEAMELRAEPREAGRVTRATLFHAGAVITVEVGNVSPGGAMIETDLPLQEGDRVVIGFEGAGPLLAEVRWAVDDRVGLRFSSAPTLQPRSA